MLWEMSRKEEEKKKPKKGTSFPYEGRQSRRPFFQRASHDGQHDLHYAAGEGWLFCPGGDCELVFWNGIVCAMLAPHVQAYNGPRIKQSTGADAYLARIIPTINASRGLISPPLCFFVPSAPKMELILKVARRIWELLIRTIKTSSISIFKN